MTTKEIQKAWEAQDLPKGFNRNVIKFFLSEFKYGNHNTESDAKYVIKMLGGFGVSELDAKRFYFNELYSKY